MVERTVERKQLGGSSLAEQLSGSSLAKQFGGAVEREQLSESS